MSEASILLKNTDMNILDIALLFRYNSQEAFTRPFEGNFGITPAKYRRADINVPVQKRINFLCYKKRVCEKLNITRPELVHLPYKTIMGYEYKTNLNNGTCFDEVALYYGEFLKTKLPFSIFGKFFPEVVYGMGYDFKPDGSVSFLIGCESSVPHELTPGGTLTRHIPEGKYVLFKALGTFGVIRHNIEYVYDIWLPYSNYELREELHIEAIDLRCSSYPDKISWTFYVPVK